MAPKRVLGASWGSSVASERQGWGSTAGDPSPDWDFLIPWPLLDPTLGTSVSCWAIPGALLGGTRPSFGRTGGPRWTPWRRLGAARVRSEPFQKTFKTIYCSFHLPSIEVIWDLSGVGPRQHLGSLRCSLALTSLKGKTSVHISGFSKNAKGSPTVHL